MRDVLEAMAVLWALIVLTATCVEGLSLLRWMRWYLKDIRDVQRDRFLTSQRIADYAEREASRPQPVGFANEDGSLDPDVSDCDCPDCRAYRATLC